METHTGKVTVGDMPGGGAVFTPGVSRRKAFVSRHIRPGPRELISRILEAVGDKE